MTTKELILKEIEDLKEDQLKNVYEKIKAITKESKNKKTTYLFNELRKIEIDGPKDFAENFKLYLSGEKIAE
jgi:hypothetical protein